MGCEDATAEDEETLDREFRRLVAWAAGCPERHASSFPIASGCQIPREALNETLSLQQAVDCGDGSMQRLWDALWPLSPLNLALLQLYGVCFTTSPLTATEDPDERRLTICSEGLKDG